MEGAADSVPAAPARLLPHLTGTPLPVPPSVLRPSLPSPEMLAQMATANLQSPNGPG